MNPNILVYKHLPNEEPEHKQLIIDSNTDYFCSPNAMASIEIHTINTDDRAKVRKFVTTYRDLPVLWDVKSLEYTRKDKRNAAYDILLQVFRTIKSDATVEDVKKKINSMRSNFRKELKRVTESKSNGMNYRPTSWIYEELMFLKDIERPQNDRRKSFAVSDDDMTNNHDVSRVESSDIHRTCPQFPISKKPRYVEVKQKYAHPTVFNSCEYMSANEGDIAKVWTSKLKYLDHMQRLFAEKAINDVLFEAQLGTLHRNSVRINECPEVTTANSSSNQRGIYDHRLEPTQSSPEYKYSESDEFRSDDN